jgi:HNH endonuclease
VEFPPSVSDKVLIACGPHCVLCHRHVAVRIELHHIVPEAAGGPDTRDNRILVCFDCHADMRGLAAIAEEPRDSADEYLDSDLESLRAQLIDAIEQFVYTTVD